jgi:hypothetical protein
LELAGKRIGQAQRLGEQSYQTPPIHISFFVVPAIIKIDTGWRYAPGPVRNRSWFRQLVHGTDSHQLLSGARIIKFVAKQLDTHHAAVDDSFAIVQDGVGASWDVSLEVPTAANSNPVM